MGAATSISERILSNTYVSYAENDNRAVFLLEELVLRKSSNFFGPVGEIVKTYGLTSQQLEPTIKNIMSNSSHIIICVSRATVGSFNQAIEINRAGHSNANIIYIMTDKSYTPDNRPFLRDFIMKHEWFPAYDGETMDDTIEKLVVLLGLDA